MNDVSETAEVSPETIGTPPASRGRNGAGSMTSRAATFFLRQREASVLIIAVVLFIYFAATTSHFVSHGSFVIIAQYMAPYVIIGIGLVLLMVCLEIDLSVGFVWMLSPFVMRFFVDSGIPTLIAIVITVLILAVVIGGINGVVTTIFGVPSLITTLATGFIVFGYALTISSAQQVNIPASSLGLGHWFGFEAWSEFIWATVLVLIFHVILTRTRWGLYTVSVGGNLLGAQGSRDQGQPDQDRQLHDVQRARRAGRDHRSLQEQHHRPERRPAPGAADRPGRGGDRRYRHGRRLRHRDRLWLGMLVLGILQDGFNLRGISSNKYQIILGAAILLAMIANTYLARLRNAGRLQAKS